MGHNAKDKLTKIALVGLALVGMLGLSACSTELTTTEDLVGDAREITIALKDGRVLPCVRVYQGLSCDWLAANGITATLVK